MSGYTLMFISFIPFLSLFSSTNSSNIWFEFWLGFVVGDIDDGLVEFLTDGLVGW